MKLQKISVSLAVVGLALGSLSTASAAVEPAAKVMGEIDSACRQTQDQFEVAYRFTGLSRKFSGQCIDSTRFRAIQNLSVKNGLVALNGYQHLGQFWTAKFSIEPQNVEAAYVQIVRFPILGIVEAAHVQMRFKLKKSIQLENHLDPSKLESTNDVVVSFEAARPKGESYNFALGAVDNYGLVGRVVSGQQRILDGNPQTEQYELAISPDERAELLRSALEHAQAIGTKSTYNTLRPNCTTEVFDLIDGLPRFKGKFAPFLTVISNDPVAQPSIDAMKARGVLKNRVQNLEEELKGVTKIIPLAEKKRIPIIPQVADRPWTLVVTLPDLTKLAPSERAAVLKVRAELLRQAPVILQGLGSAMMKEAGMDAANLLTGGLEVLQKSLMNVLAQSEAALPNTPQAVGLYLVPFKAALSQTPLTGLGIPAALPFAIHNAVVDDAMSKSKEIFYHIAEGTRLASDDGAKGKLPGYLMGAAVRLKLQRNDIQIRSQLLVGLNDQTRPFTMTNSQVAFSESSLTGSRERSTRPLMLLTQTQIGLSSVNPRVTIEFGSSGGLAGTMAGDGFATFQVYKEFNGSCEMQALSSPTLKGQLASSALGKPILDKLIAGKKVAFHVLGAEVDARSLEIKQMDVRINTWPLDCLSVGSVNEQFKTNANQMLTQLKSEARNGDLLQKLIKNYLN